MKFYFSNICFILGTPDEVWVFCENLVMVWNWEFTIAKEFGTVSELPFTSRFDQTKQRAHVDAA